MRYPASYSNTSHSGVSTETVQSQFSDLYGNHLNVEKADSMSFSRLPVCQISMMLLSADLSPYLLSQV